jgi:acetylornithine aminotransferase
MDNILWTIGHELRIRNIVKAENCMLWDASGRRYLDLESGVWCTSVGHCNPRVNAVLKQQADAIAHTGYVYAHPVIAETAERILALTGLTGGKCVFLCSGSEAVEFAIRVARAVTGKPLILSMADSYYGAYGAANRKAASEWLAYDWLSQANRTPGADGFAGIAFDQVAGLLLEPGSSSGMVRFAPADTVSGLSQQVNKHGGLYLVNEVTTGIGRTGEWFGFQHYSPQPELVAIGKGIGNGYPVSALALSARVAEALNKSDFRYSQSHQNDPLGAAVAGEVLRIIAEEGLVARARRLGDRLKQELQSIGRGTGVFREVRGRGLMLAIEVDDTEPFRRTEALYRGLLERGVIVALRPKSSVLRLDPALTIPESDLDFFLEEIQTATRSV